VQAASKKFLDGYKAAFRIDPILYAPFNYDAAKLLISAMVRAGSADPAKYLSVLAGSDYSGATGRIRFDEKGDRKDAEMTLFTLKDGRITPVAILKSGKSMTLDEFAQTAILQPNVNLEGPSSRTRLAGTANLPLVFEFDASSWIEVRDATQKIVFVGEYPKGTHRVVEGQPPFQVWIGQASAVRVTYRGRRIDLAPHTREEIARLAIE
jgi:hypothetical protein